MKKVTIQISNEDYKALNILSLNGSDEKIEKMIKEAIKVYICSWLQYIPYIQKHPEWVCPEIFECLDKDDK